jgi:hypothetical protein
MTRIPDTHAEAWALLPWLANGRVAPEDREWLEAHVQGCAECRAELASQRLVASHVNRDESASPPAVATEEQRSFNKLWARIEASESAATPATGTTGLAVPVPRSSRTVRWLAAAVVVQAIGLAMLGLTVNNQNAGDGFMTVSTPEPRLNAPAVSIAFAPQTSMGTVNTLLTHQGLSLVGGPGSAGNYRAELSADAVASGATADSVAAVLSRDPNVTFAQPIAR